MIPKTARISRSPAAMKVARAEKVDNGMASFCT
jgi:hypothetical protein